MELDDEREQLFMQWKNLEEEKSRFALVQKSQVEKGEFIHSS